ncbi:MAG: hypothetical protein A2Y07_03570 [Planctomycetes bacterium GWF2_50_10]|nr:MAG: hypothetical protein A2Y07_03570 [Planctomycetes bacterium GWF2_50_10]
MILPIVKLMRLHYSVPVSCGLIAITMYLNAGRPFNSWPLILTACSALCSTISAAYILNDVIDISVDRINRPSRMISSGMVSCHNAAIWAILLFCVGLVVAALCGKWFFAGILIITAMLIYYDIFSKRIGLFKDVLCAALMTSLYPLSLTLVNVHSSPQAHSLFYSSVWLFLTCLSYQMYKDSGDSKGDVAAGPKSIAFYSSQKWFLSFARIIAIVASFLPLLIWMLGYCGTVFLITSIMAIVLAVISTRRQPYTGIMFIYAEIAAVSAGAVLDLLILAP